MVVSVNSLEVKLWNGLKDYKSQLKPCVDQVIEQIKNLDKSVWNKESCLQLLNRLLLKPKSAEEMTVDYLVLFHNFLVNWSLDKI